MGNRKGVHYIRVGTLGGPSRAVSNDDPALVGGGGQVDQKGAGGSLLQ